MATEQGVVIKTNATVAIVKTKKSEACATCASRHSCNTMGNDMEVAVINRIGAKEGDRIVLNIQSGPFLKATFLIYMFPILCMVLGAIIGEKLSLSLDFGKSALSAAFGFSFFILAIGMVKIKGKKMGEKEAYRPKIIRILK